MKAPFLSGAVLLLVSSLLESVHSRTCLPPYSAETSYVGCYHDPNTPRDLAGPLLTVGNLNSPQYCANVCGAAGYTYFGVEYTVQCFCGHRIENTAIKADESQCSDHCPADPSKACGGGNMINIYSITNPVTDAPPSPSFPDCKRDPLCSNDICDSSLSTADRARALVAAMTLEEKVFNLGSAASGSARLGLPSYQWQNEALHGLAGSTGVQFQEPLGANFSAATSFPMPILLASAFDDELVKSVAEVISIESRAFGNAGFAGLNFWTPNINPFRDPRWGRGMETPGEDPYHIQNYVYSLIDGLQGGINPDIQRIISTCKHFAAYDIEDGRTANDLSPTAQDMSEYYLPMFRTCVRDAKVTSVMCSYNSVYGVPACASSYLLEDILRDHWGFTQSHNYVVSDCDSIDNIFDPHHYAKDRVAASAYALNAGTDLDCGSTYNNLNASVASGLTTEATMDKSLVRLYSALVKVGYFDPLNSYTGLNWANVNTSHAREVAYRAATEGMVLLKNDGTLPLPLTISNVAIIGPWANATDQMQGNYAGTAPFLVSPLEAFHGRWSNLHFIKGADIDSSSTDGFADALAAARASDYIIYLGGIDTSVENEGHDRSSISWPGNQLDLVSQLSSLGKPLVIVQFGGGQIDDTALLDNNNVNSILWAGYPGQNGGNAVLDVLTGVAPPAGRLSVTQYPTNYIDNNDIRDMSLRPDARVPGRTYKWFTGKPVLPFGHGLHYTNFSLSWHTTPTTQSADIESIVRNAEGYKDLATFAVLVANVKNSGGDSASKASDYVGMLFLSSENAGDEPRPSKQLVSYDRVHNVGVNSTDQLSFEVTLGSLARADSDGDMYIYPGVYTLTVDIDAKIAFSFTLTGKPTMIDSLPRRRP